MNAKQVLTNYLNLVTPSMHKTRRACLSAVLGSVMQGAVFSVTTIGRQVAGKALEKHRIKRVDRLCSNPHMQGEEKAIYHRMAYLLVGKPKRPVLHVDWSDLDDCKKHFLIRASLAAEGRSLTLFEEVHPLATKEKPKTHKAFLQALKAMLPADCCPIIVTDAGFRIPWFTLVRSLGWDYVGRVRNRTHCQKAGEQAWHPVKMLYKQATQKAKALGHYRLGEKQGFLTSLFIYHRPPKGRKDKTADGKNYRRSKLSRANAEREKEPWLIATSLSEELASAKEIIKLYGSRMQIEEAFRDIKTGLGMNACKTRNIKRLRVLFVLAAIAQFLLYLTGLAVKQAGKHYRYQANSIKYRNVLSNQYIGLRAYRDKWLKLTRKHWLGAIRALKDITRSPIECAAG